MAKFLLICLLALSAGMAQARCSGIDLRQHLTAPAQKQLSREIAKIPFAYGNHWIASKGGRQIHILGTQHSGDSRMRAVMRRMRPLIRASDLVLLEVTGAQIRQAQTKPAASSLSYYTLPRGRTLPQLLTAQDWRLLSQRLAHMGLHPSFTAHLQPWVASHFLAGTYCRGRGLFASAGLDDRVERIAQRAGVPVRPLETTEAGYKALAAQPLRDQLELLKLDLNSGTNFDSQAITQSEAYFQESLAEAIIVQRWTIYRDLPVPRREVARLLRQFDAQLLDRRNRAWLPVIEKAPGSRIFVAVGAAHLPGRAGLLNLLKQRGYKLQRAAF
jgi:uncharacterized protein YbaP (TraB family)